MAETATPPANPFADPTSALPNPGRRREAWKEKASAGRGRTGKPIPKPATAKEAKAIVKKLAQEAAVAIATDKSLDLSKDAKARYAAMSSITRAHILSYLGEDIEAARSEFANELMANARKVAGHIMENFQEYPASVQAFVFTAFVDKSEALHAKAATNPKTAAVGAQINVFMDGSVDREKLIGQLTGAAFGVQEPKPVVAVQAVPVPPADAQT